jgi:hypothetical protein
MDQSEYSDRRHREPWSKGKLVGQKAPLRLKGIWVIRIRLQLAERVRELALFNLAVDSKLRSCDLVRLRVKDVTRGDRVAAPANGHSTDLGFGVPATGDISRNSTSSSAAPAGSKIHLCLAKIAHIQR